MDTAARSQPHRRRPARRRVVLWSAFAAAVAVVGLVVFVLVWFQPQKLFIDDLVVEAVPTVPPTSPSPPTGPGTPITGTPTTGTPPTATEPPAEPVALARGELVSLDHGTRGTVRVIELADGRRYLRFEGLDTSNGPDLYVYLTANPAAGEEGAFDDDFVNLGRLKGNQGDQNYELPEATDIRRHMTVVIWCDRFNSAFGAADLVVT